ncbi:MAG: hypothetical protein WC197_02395, partial [Candidatus Gastranaerophilaceae bacterium]
KNIFKKGIFKVIKVKIKHVKLSEPVLLTGGEFTVEPDKFYTNGLQSIAFGAKALLIGEVTGLKSGKEENQVQNLHFNIYDFDVKNMPAVIKSNAVKPDVKQALNYYNYKQGKMNVKINLLDKKQIVTMYFKDTSADYTPTNTPLLFKNGSMTVDTDDMSFDNLNVMINNSYVHLNGRIKNYLKKPVYDFFLNSYTDANDFNTKIAPIFNVPIEAKGKIPLSVIFKGNINNWKIRSQVNLDSNSNIYYKGSELGEKAIRILYLNAQGTPDEIMVNNFKISTPFSELPENKEKAISLDDAQKLETLLEIKGRIKDFKEIHPTFDNFRISAFKPINISLLNGFIKNSEKDQPFFTRGEFQGHLNIQGKTNSPLINGNFSLSNIRIPSFATFIKLADIDFSEKSIIIKDSSINIAGSSRRVWAIKDNVLETPL